MAVLLLHKIMQIPKFIYVFIKMAVHLLCSVIDCASHVLFTKKHLLPSEISETVRFKPFDFLLALSIILLSISSGTSPYLFLILEIVFTLNILIIILFQRIKVPNSLI
ncbi:hypothetical protein Bccel_2468 [Pseudobacteroides cellulosolvens ATCC 35603 = DSM 2933]|uniref:Uncharacterized protein n=1 Tax=Pseudobacteroides cellulosolvens ATCC 35603 = DSM 2933 TaxID=398512 RepID=A0A0L6JNA0_9FIRM|nr:hypothetical protein Bccel_2468 [Pseudobacteroides cellulosolvens ATCC 35603 = DSM 2933]